uniref:Putative cadherin egf lag seven-pass g-type receptor n=1 Tax=Lutzomyia longipalpis TaxID=7200 RepID=A0A1B0GHQ4_LUTLO
PLDRDQPNGRPQWRFTVFAQDEGGEGLVGYADVQVNLKDINDNAPIFPQGVYFGNVTENGTAGMVVMTMTAVDYDDPNEGTNAKLVYSIEKNVIEEGKRTAVCCLDRERTPDYSIQVVAMDGGGLKGTGTASIRVKDINDMPPQFTKDEWFTEVDETDGSNLPEMPILTVTVHDEDETNKFQYKVIDNSGYGADKFTMVRNNDGTGSLKIVQPLDYEDQLQSNGFRFRIQVSDKGEDNDNDKYHVAYSWVVVKLRDINDNKPMFERPNIESVVYENAEVGTTLETFKAVDPDQGGKGKISFAIDRSSDRQRQFNIDQSGTVTIQRKLGRENIPRHQVKILAIDDGVPPKTATATLTVIVQDINDNAPKFLKDYRPVLPEHVPPRKVVEILATDDDDRSKSNGPPFQFRLDPGADDIIRASFKVEQDQKGANGDGMAIVSSLRSFDREQQKEYLIPIVIKDHGNPAMTGTSTLTVIIGDVNDNKMQPGSKDIFVYNYQGQAPDTQIGRVYVYDLDDWDLPDKKFYWEGAEHPRFKLNEDSGMITMRQGTRDGKYHLRFKVYDRKHTQNDVPANVTVTVKEIPHEAIINSGSIRIAGITDEDFIRVWNYRTQSLSRSKLDRFRDKLSDLLNTERENVDIFSVQLRRKHPPLTDIRFSAHGSPYYKPVRLNGIVLMHREEIERDVGINITMVGIDECLYENQMCEGSCTNSLDISALPYMVNANKTALVGVRVDVQAECTCGDRNFTKSESCRTTPCYNGGRCMESRFGLKCTCPTGYTGPRCQQTTRSFRGNGWAWYPPLAMCDNSHLSLEFITRKSDGLLIYNGPIVPPERDEIIISDFIALELERGFPRLLIDFGSGTLELKVKTKKTLDDGEWHRIDLFWDTENVRMVVDYCKSAEVAEMEDGSPPEFDDSSCQARGTIPPFNEYLNVNAPLQVGGLYREQFDASLYHWHYMPVGKGFDGCIRNLIHNSKLYDFAHPGLSRNSLTGCPQTEEVCSQSEQTSRCWEHGNCVGSFSEARCQCRPGWTGPACNVPTIPTTFKQQSYVKYALSFEPDRFSTTIQLRFRTREQHGELFRVSDQHNREYGILEIKKPAYISWHVVRVNRYGSAAMLELDGGEGRRYNETFEFDGHQWLLVDKQEGVYAGGKAEYTGPLDRDQPNGRPQWRFTVFAQDEGGEGLVGYADVQVNLKDINDNAPIFPQGVYFGNVTENGTAGMVVMTMTAVDYDDPNEGTNAKLVYSIEKNVIEEETGSPIFEIEPDTGVIKTAVCCLDRERTPDYSIQVVAMDGGGLKAGTHEWFTEVDETDGSNLPEMPILTVTVHDEDETNKFQYKVIDNSGYGADKFTMVRNNDGTGSLKIVQPLDYEDQLQSNGFRFRVQLRDINDNKPMFERPNIESVVYENAEVGTTLETFKAVDPDQGGLPPSTARACPSAKVVEILATDDDDRSKSNGPPFQFRLDPGADDIIRASFKVEQDQKGANGDGMAIVSSLRSFDREQQKEYLIPIVIKDHGNPAMTGTSTLTVIIGDVNDNKMQPGSKDIFVYNYQGQAPDTQIGRVYVYDLDDWDLPDKKFYWEGAEHPRFKLNEDSGMITMRQGTRDGKYHLRFKVYDRKHTQNDVPANVTVTVKEIPHEAIINSGSIRIAGITDEDFIRVWNYRTQSLSRTAPEASPLTDIRFSAHGSPYYKPVRLNGIVLMHREEIERDVGINITMVGIDECLYENQMCEGSCTNSLDISALPYMVNANKTALVGVRVDVQAECTCGDRNFTKSESCRTTPCYNGGRCMESRFGLKCTCPTGYTGPRCQQTTRSFRGNGWAWYPPLAMCDNSHLSLEFITRKSDGLLIYNGPIVPPERDEIIISDFIALELERGFPRLLIDFGSGTLELKVKTKKTLDDGEWHRIDLFWDTENVRMVVDYCKSAEVAEMEDGLPAEFDDSSCQARGTIPPFNEYLNVNAPLQVGGLYREQFDASLYHWHYMPVGKGFDGCIRNLIHNSKLYDFAHPGLSRNSLTGCPQTEEVCSQSEQTSRCWEHGNCVGSFSEARCQCRPGWTGPACNVPTIPTTFKQQSYVKYALSFEPDRFSTTIQLRFRTREQHGELFRVSDQHNREYGILEIKEARLHFRYNLNSLRTEEKDLWLNSVTVDDGQWHVVRVNRYGSAAMLELDGGEGRRYNETFEFDGHQWLLVDKQEGVYAGGKAEYTGVRTFEVYADYQKSCLDDIRLEGKHLPLPPAMNGTQWGQATMARNLERNCPSNKPCANVICPDPFECVDLWNEYECTNFHLKMIQEKREIQMCGNDYTVSGGENDPVLHHLRQGRIMAPDGKGCIDRNECIDLPCLNGATCINLEPRLRYRCICPDGFWGENCELIQEGQTLKLSMGALAAILVCLLIILKMGVYICPVGYRISGNNCVNENECQWFPCRNGGRCRDLNPPRRYECRCPRGYTGMNCELELLASGVITPSKDFIIALLVCLSTLILLVLVFVVYNRRREAHIKYPGPDDDVRENIINYDDEGGGEDDMTAFDITPLQIPIGSTMPELTQCKMPIMYPVMTIGPGQEPNVGLFIEEHKKRADSDPNAPPFDDLRNYAYEGGGSTAGSLSSLASGTDDECHEYDYLGAWGPRFDKLANMYGPEQEQELDEM